MILLLSIVLYYTCHVLCLPCTNSAFSSELPPSTYQPPLPLCPSFRCTCCNRSNILAINREMQGALGDEPSVFSPQCAQALLLVKCRICDPEVGQDKKPSVCPSLCSSWLKACRNDFFGFSFSGDLLPCTTLSSTRILLCSRLHELLVEQWEDKETKFEPERELCKLVGLQVADPASELCYDGSIGSISSSTCDGASLIVQPSQKQDKTLDGSFTSPLSIVALCLVTYFAVRIWHLIGAGGRKGPRRGGSGLTDQEKEAIAKAVEARQVQVENRNERGH